VQDEAFRVIPVLLPQADPLIIDQFLELRTWVRFDLGLDDGAALALLLSGIRGVPPGRPSMPIDDVVGNARNRLLQIKRFLVDDLIEREVALEYQRKIIDDILRG